MILLIFPVPFLVLEFDSASEFFFGSDSSYQNRQGVKSIEAHVCMYKNKDIINVEPKLLNQTLTIL